MRDYQKEFAGKTVVIPVGLRSVIGDAIVTRITELGHRVLAVSVGRTHAHLLVELPADFSEVKREVGRVKRYASRAVTEQMPGQLWGEGGKFKTVSSREQQRAVFRYITQKQERGSWVWSFKQGPPV